MGLFGRKPDTQPEPQPEAAIVDVTSEPRQAPKPEWGKPGRCPECGGPGYLEHIDMVDRIMYTKCKECGHHWEVSQAEILAAQQQ